MKVKELQLGDKIDIRLLQEVNKSEESNETPVIHNYLSSIFDIRDDEIIIIHMPTVGTKMVLLNEGLRYEFLFTNAKTAAMYKAEGEVVKRFKKENFYLLAIKLNTELTRFQRREYYRMNCMFPVTYQTIDKELSMMNSMEEIYEVLKLERGTMRVRGLGTALDISGGGIRFIASSSLDDVEYLILQFKLEQGELLVANIEVMAFRVRTEYKDSVGKYEHRMKFLFKDPRDREIIIKYIFDEERRLRKRDQG